MVSNGKEKAVTHMLAPETSIFHWSKQVSRAHLTRKEWGRVRRSCAREVTPGIFDEF